MTVIVKPSTPVRDIPDFALEEVVVRLARPDEHSEWDRLMDEHHYLGFRQFAGRGLRYIAEWRGQWLALPGWQTGVFQCAPRDEWLGWHRAVQMRRLHLIANNTRFLILPAGADVPNLGSCVLGANLQRLSADWQAAWGHPLLLAETFVEMRLYRGTVYRAANWIAVGLTQGYARSNGKYTDKHGVKKKMLVYPLQGDARALLRDPLLITRLVDAALPTLFGGSAAKFVRLFDFGWGGGEGTARLTGEWTEGESPLEQR